MTVFDERLSAYRIAKAELDRHCAVDPLPDQLTDHDKELDRVSSAHTEAMDALLLTPAPRMRDLMTKLRITAAEQAHDNWHLAAPIMALLVDDGERLLERGRA